MHLLVVCTIQKNFSRCYNAFSCKRYNTTFLDIINVFSCRRYNKTFHDIINAFSCRSYNKLFKVKTHLPVEGTIKLFNVLL